MREVPPPLMHPCLLLGGVQNGQQLLHLGALRLGEGVCVPSRGPPGSSRRLRHSQLLPQRLDLVAELRDDLLVDVLVALRDVLDVLRAAERARRCSVGHTQAPHMPPPATDRFAYCSVLSVSS